MWTRKLKAWLFVQGIALNQLLDNVKKETKDESAAASSSSTKEKESDALKLKLTNDRIRVYWCIITCLSDSENRIVASLPEGDLLTLWSDLEKRHRSNSLQSKIHIRKVMHSIKMNKEEPFDLYKAKLLQCKERLVLMGETVSDTELLYILLQGLPHGYELVQKTLELSMNDQNQITFELACNKIREQQEREGIMNAERNSNRNNNYNRSNIQETNFVAAAYEKGRRNNSSSSNDSSSNSNPGSNSSSGKCRVCLRRVDHSSRPWECPARRGEGNACFICGDNRHQMKNCPDDKSKKGMERGMYANVEEDTEISF